MSNQFGSAWMNLNKNPLNGTGLMRPEDQLEQQLQQIPNKGKAPAQGMRVPQSNEVISMEEEQVQAQPPPTDPEAEMNKMYLDQVAQSQSRAARAQSEMDQLGEQPKGLLAADLSPLANMVGLGDQYKAPTMKSEYDKKKALLQGALEKGQNKVTEDQLNYLKLAADKKKNEESLKLRELMLSQRGEKGDTDYEMKLRKEYMGHPMYKQMGELDAAYQGIESNPGVGGPAQQALVYQFSKILDPGSVVRETEYAVSAANAGKIAQARNYFTMLQSGQMLTPEQVNLMKEVSRGLVMSARGSLNKHNQTYQTLAQRKGIDPTLIVTDNFTQSVPQGPQVDPARARLDELRKKAGKQ
jgi:hypothetical protein